MMVATRGTSRPEKRSALASSNAVKPMRPAAKIMKSALMISRLTRSTPPSTSPIAIDVGLGDGVQLLLGAGDLVFADLLERVEVVLRLAADVADRHLRVFALTAHDLHELLATLLGELRQGGADDCAVVADVGAEVRRG